MTDMHSGIISIRFRAFPAAILLVVLICGLTPFNNVYRNATPLGGGHFPLAPFCILFMLTLMTALSEKMFRGRKMFTGGEILTMWVMAVLASGIAYTGLARTFFLNLTVPFHYATEGNRWREVLHPLLPNAWYPNGGEAIRLLYNGLPGGRDMSWIDVLKNIPWHAWLSPIALWSAFVLICYGVMICLVNLFSRQWIYNERMNFPLLRVPVLLEEALDEGKFFSLFKNPFLIAGLAVPAFLHLTNGLHFYFPSVPEIPTLILAGPYFPKTGLFSGFVKLRIFIYPVFIGFAFLTTRQISFSFWLCFLAGALFVGLLGAIGLDIPAATVGVMFGPTISRPEEMQMIGAYGVFFLFIIWLARFHLIAVTRNSLRITRGGPGDMEWFGTGLSFWGTFAGLIAVFLWLWFFGMPVAAAALTTLAFFMVMLVAVRVICQGGIAYFTLTAAPIDGLIAIFGPGFFAGVGLLVAAVTQKVLFVDLRESLMPSLLHARKVSQDVKNRRTVVWWIIAAIIVSMVVSFAAMLALCHKYGIRELHVEWATQTTTDVYQNVVSLVESPPSVNRWIAIFSFAGAAIMLALVFCFRRYYWWPLHPIGYLTAYSSAMRILWFSIFVGWLANALCMKYGGVALFKRLRYFFIGLIIGDLLMGGAWAVVALFTDGGYLVLPD